MRDNAVAPKVRYFKPNRPRPRGSIADLDIAPVWTSTPNPPDAVEGESYNYDLRPHLNTSFGVVITSTGIGSLPTGIVISGLTLTGVPTATGIFGNLNLTATNTQGSDESDVFDISIAALAWISTPTPPNGDQGVAYNYDMAPHLNSTENISLSTFAGVLPAGLNYSGTRIVGTPTAVETQTGIQTTASNGVGSDNSPAYSLQIEGIVGTADIRLDNPVQAGKEVLDQGTEVFSAVATFPRIGGYQIGSKDYHDAPYREGLKKLDLVIFDFFRDWSRGGYTINTLVAEIRAANPDMRIGQYVTCTQAEADSLPSGAEYDMRVKLDSEVGPSGIGDWWGYLTNGTKPIWQGGTREHTNWSEFVTPDANGDRWPQWRAKRDKSVYFDVADFDFIFIDNFRDEDWTGNGKIDLNRDGTTFSDPVQDQYYREGQVAFATQFRSILPGYAVVGNTTLWTKYNRVAPPPEYDDFLSGAYLEHAIGASWSPEGVDADGVDNGWGSWDRMMTEYRNCEDWTHNEIVLFNTRGYVTNYKQMRYGLCSCLMGDGYYDYTDNNNIYDFVHWFDEYDYNLGAAIQSRQTSAYQSGVYVRGFENGLAVVNPRENGQQTITLPSAGSGFHWEYLDATDYESQDIVHNPGGPVINDQLTIADRDGFIIKRVPD